MTHGLTIISILVRCTIFTEKIICFWASRLFFAFGGSLIKKDNFEQGSTILGFGVELNVIYKITERVGFSGGITGQYNFYTIGSQFLNDIKIANLTGRLTQYVVTPYLCFDIYFERK